MEPSTVGTSDASAGSSPAPVSAQAVVESLNTEERTSWQKTGDLPERVSLRDSRPARKTNTDVAAASSPAEPVEQAASTDASLKPASEPGAPQKRTGHSGNADTRVQELLEERRRDRDEVDRLRREMDDLRRSARPDASAASSPAKPTTQAEYERYLAMPDAPEEGKFDSLAKFTAAMSIFIADKRSQEHGQRTQMHQGIERELQAIEQTGATARERLKAATQADPQFVSKVHRDLLDIPTLSQVRAAANTLHAQGRTAEAQELLKTINGTNALAEELARSEHIDKLLLHFSSETGQADWHRIASLRGNDFVRAFVRLEHQMASAPSAPALKHVSTAPTPATTVGTRTADTADAVDAAVKSGDSSRYAREVTRRELAGLKG